MSVRIRGYNRSIAPRVVDINYETSVLNSLAEQFEEGRYPIVVSGLNTNVGAHNLLSEIGQGRREIRVSRYGCQSTSIAGNRANYDLKCA